MNDPLTDILAHSALWAGILFFQDTPQRVIPPDLRWLTVTTRSPSAQEVIHLMLPETGNSLALNQHLGDKVWKLLWAKRDELANTAVASLIWQARSSWRVDIVLDSNPGREVVKELVKGLKLSEKQRYKAARLARVRLSQITRWQRMPAKQVLMRPLSPPDEVRERLIRKQDAGENLKHTEDRDMLVHILETDLDPYGLKAWENAIMLMLGGYSGTVNELTGTARLL